MTSKDIFGRIEDRLKIGSKFPDLKIIHETPQWNYDILIKY